MGNRELLENNGREVLEGDAIERQLDYGVEHQKDDEVEVLEAAPLYTSLCDIMGLDLYKAMVEIGNSERPEVTAAQYSAFHGDFCIIEVSV